MKITEGQPFRSLFLTRCDLCKTEIRSRPNELFVTGRTRLVARGSTWTAMCLDCFRKFGLGLGSKKGQMFWFEGKTKKWVVIA